MSEKPILDITVYDGKYRVIFTKTSLTALRNGEPWRDLCGDGLVLALAQEIESLQEQLNTTRRNTIKITDDHINEFTKHCYGDSKCWDKLAYCKRCPLTLHCHYESKKGDPV